ncbi:hypothetical protein MMC13_000784 [Lambiella insularis]|nr:hypothetical protein [Lambiella insularis]
MPVLGEVSFVPAAFGGTELDLEAWPLNDASLEHNEKVALHAFNINGAMNRAILHAIFKGIMTVLHRYSGDAEILSDIHTRLLQISKMGHAHAIEKDWEIIFSEEDVAWWNEETLEEVQNGDFSQETFDGALSEIGYWLTCIADKTFRLFVNMTFCDMFKAFGQLGQQDEHLYRVQLREAQGKNSELEDETQRLRDELKQQKEAAQVLLDEQERITRAYQSREDELLENMRVRDRIRIPVIFMHEKNIPEPMVVCFAKFKAEEIALRAERRRSHTSSQVADAGADAGADAEEPPSLETRLRNAITNAEGPPSSEAEEERASKRRRSNPD